VVQKLVTAGLVQSVRSAEDRRSVQLSMTDKGRKTLKKAPSAVQDHIVEGLETMPLRDRRELARLLTRLVDSIAVPELPAGMLMEDVKRRSRVVR
jgi:DNA-binding MarR family transcriptional regulator